MGMLPVSAFAVSVDQITKDLQNDLQSVLPKPADIKIPSLGGTEYGELEKNQTQLQIKNFDLIYSAPPPVVLQQNIAKWVSKYNGQNVTLQKVVEITREVEQEIVKLGYPLVRVVLPAQQFSTKNAQVKLNIVSGFIEDIVVDVGDTDTMKDFVKRDISMFIVHAWAELKSKKFLHRDNLNRTLLVLKSHYGIEPKLFVSAGQGLGGFNLNVSVTYTPKVNFVSLKNNLGAAFNHYAVQYVGMFNDIFPTHSRQIRLISIFSVQQQSDAYYRMAKLEYNRKSVTGKQLGIYASVNRTVSVLRGAAKNPAVNQGVNNGYGVSYTLPLSTQFHKNTKLQFALDVVRDSAFNSNTKQFIHEDRTSRFSATYLYDIESGNVKHDVRITYSMGLDIFDAKSNTQNGIKSSKQGAINTNDLYDVYYKYHKSYPNFLHHITINGQYASKRAILSGQKFSLMGGDKVAGFVGNGLSADSGWALNTGVTFKTIKVDNRGYSPTVDVAFASGKLYNPTGVESPNLRANSIKFGISTNIGRNKWEVGYSLSRKYTLTSDNDAHISLNVLRLF